LRKCHIVLRWGIVKFNEFLYFKNSDLTINGNFVLNYPFIQNSVDEDKLEMSLRLTNIQTQGVGIRDILIKEVTIEDSSSTLLATAIYNEYVDMKSNMATKKLLLLSEVNKYDQVDQIKVKIENSIGQWTIINPNLYDPVKDKNK